MLQPVDLSQIVPWSSVVGGSVDSDGAANPSGGTICVFRRKTQLPAGALDSRQRRQRRQQVEEAALPRGQKLFRRRPVSEGGIGKFKSSPENQVGVDAEELFRRDPGVQLRNLRCERYRYAEFFRITHEKSGPETRRQRLHLRCTTPAF